MTVDGIRYDSGLKVSRPLVCLRGGDVQVHIFGNQMVRGVSRRFVCFGPTASVSC